MGCTGASVLLGKSTASTTARVAIASSYPYCYVEGHSLSLSVLPSAQKTHLQFVREGK